MAPERLNISSGGPLEATYGYSRAVRVGRHVVVAGSTTYQADGVEHPGDVYAQSRAVFDLIAGVLAEAGSGLTDVIRTRAFITDITQSEAYGRAHGEVFGDIRPASTLVEVSALLHPDVVIEIEAEAFITTT